jgi:anti-sigma regulatory factor (Ser/Thr protein kinase)
VDTLNGSVRLAVPADPGSISIVRAVVASVGSKLDLAYEAVDDLRIAAAEASALLLTAGGDGTRLCAELEPVADGLRIALWIEGSDAAGLDQRDGIAWRVIEGLTDHTDVVEVEGHRGIELLARAVRR